jgi:hypothetical protein
MKIFVHYKFCSGKDGFALQFASSSMKVPICAEMPVVFVCKEGLMGICVVMQSHSAVSKSHTCPRCTLKHFVTKCYRTSHCHIISYYLISLPWLSLLEPLRRPTVKWLQLLRSTYEKLLWSCGSLRSLESLDFRDLTFSLMLSWKIWAPTSSWPSGCSETGWRATWQSVWPSWWAKKNMKRSEMAHDKMILSGVL